MARRKTYLKVSDQDQEHLPFINDADWPKGLAVIACGICGRRGSILQGVNRAVEACKFFERDPGVREWVGFKQPSFRGGGKCWIPTCKRCGVNYRLEAMGYKLRLALLEYY